MSPHTVPPQPQALRSFPILPQVHFTTTLFALIRENLCIKMRPAEEMDQADSELRQTIKKIWPIQAKKNLNLIVPPDDGECTAEARQSVLVVLAAIRVSCRLCCPRLFRLVWMLPNTRIVTRDSYKLRVTGIVT